MAGIRNPDQPKRTNLGKLVRVGLPLSLMAWGVYAQSSARHFVRNSLSTTAELISRPEIELKIRRSQFGQDSSHTDHRVFYKFSVDDKTYTGHDSVETAPVGAGVRIYYEVGNPANNRINLPEAYEGGIWIGLALLLGIVLGPNFWNAPPAPETGQHS